MKLANLWPFSNHQSRSNATLQKPPVFLFSFANDKDQWLKGLSDEDRAIRDALRHLDRRQEIKHHSIGQTNLDDLYNTFNGYHEQIYIFHYAGHSNSESLQLEGQNTRSQSLATLFGQQPLKLVFLNGCSNEKQVKDLFQAGIPAVIATRANISDRTSQILADQFYKALAGGKNIKQAFESAVSYVEHKKKPKVEIAYRGIKLEHDEDESFRWGLYCQDEKVLKWRIEDAKTLESVSDLKIQETRKTLLKKYENRLNSKLVDRLPINLELKYSTEGTNTKAEIYDNKKIQSTEINEEVISLFDKHNGRLLIVGTPGSGKTILLLQLAIQLMKREEIQIPVIIDMVTWRKRFSSVEEWLKELLPQMGFSETLAKQLLQDNLLLPLFDGLDELDEMLRQPCLEAIAEYGSKEKAQYVICSRITEYAHTVDAPVRCQIKVKPLTLKQIEKSLEYNNSNAKNGILNAIAKDPHLKKAIETPFYLNTIQSLFSTAKLWEAFDFKADTLEGRQKEIVERFIEHATSGIKKYPTAKVKKWLGFLADRMNWKGMVEFELVDLQYDWVRPSTSANFLGSLVYGLPYALVSGLIIGLLFGLIGWWDQGLSAGLTSGLKFGLGAGLGTWLRLSVGLIRVGEGTLGTWLFLGFLGLLVSIMSLSWSETGDYVPVVPLQQSTGLLLGLLITGYVILGESEDMFVDKLARIETRDAIHWSFSIFREKLGEGLLGGAGMGLVIGFVLVLADGPDSWGSWLFTLLIGGPILGLLFGGLTFGLLGGLISGLGGQFENNTSFLKITNPYKRFRASMRALHFSILQHYHLRWLLYRKGWLPIKLVFFFKKATEKNLLESDGSSWRFRHRILQEYFADHWGGGV